MTNLLTSRAYVKSISGQPISHSFSPDSSQLYPQARVYDPFALDLSPRGWLVYAFQAYWSGTHEANVTTTAMADQLRVSLSTVKRGTREIDEKNFRLPGDHHVAHAVEPGLLGKLFQRGRYNIPLYFAIATINYTGHSRIHYKTLTEMVGCSYPTIVRSLNTLDLFSLIVRSPNVRDNGTRSINSLKVRPMAQEKRQTNVVQNVGQTSKRAAKKRRKKNKRSPQTPSGITKGSVVIEHSTYKLDKRVNKLKGLVRQSDSLTSDEPSARGLRPGISSHSSLIVEVTPTHEELLQSGDLLDQINKLSPGSRRLNSLRRPDDPFLFVSIREHKFLNRIVQDYDYAEEYREKFWQRVFRNEKPSAMRRYMRGPVVRHVKDTTSGEQIPVTEEIENLAQKVYVTYTQFIRARYSMYVRLARELKRGTHAYNHFVRIAFALIEARAVRYLRLWVLAQFDDYEDLQSKGFMKRRSYPQPNYLYGENAENRFYTYMERRIEEVRNLVCVDESIAVKLYRFADIQEKAALNGEEPPTAREYLTSEEAEMMFMGRSLLIRFFGLQAPAE